MVILHVAAISDNPFTGVCVVVPDHVIAQSQYAKVGFLNITNEEIPKIGKQINFQKPFKLSFLSEPFNKPDLVVFHECYRVEYIAIANKLRKENIPYIIVPHAELRKEAQKRKWLKKGAANILLFNRFIKNSVALQCLSDEEMYSTNFEKNKFICTNGINIPQKKKKVFHKRQVQLVYIGRYEWKQKGLDIMLDAIKKIEIFMQQNHCHVDMYGPDIFGRYDYIENMILEREISDIVTLHREVSGKEKEDILLGADIFIQTSRFEGMPMGILEAMSYGIPCLITQGTTLGDVIKESGSGWAVETTCDGVANGIMNAIVERKEWEKYGDSARFVVKKTFAWNVIARETVGKYETLISTANYKVKLDT